MIIDFIAGVYRILELVVKVFYSFFYADVPVEATLGDIEFDVFCLFLLVLKECWHLFAFFEEFVSHYFGLEHVSRFYVL